MRRRLLRTARGGAGSPGASSGALIGFGLDSVIEVASAAAVAWQFSGRDPEARERRALRAIAISFFALAIHVTAEAAGTFFTGTAPETSRTGIVLAAVSLAVAVLEGRTAWRGQHCC